MLSALIWIPILGAIVVGLLPGSISDLVVRRSAIAVISLTLIVSLVVATQFDVINIGLQFSENIPWLEPLGLTYRLGLDGLSLPLIVLNSFLTLIALFSTDLKVQRSRLYYALVLVINAAVAGAFLSHNLLLFFLFYEMELIPLYLLIAIWGGARRGYASTKFLIYTAVSGILILMAFLGLTWLSGASSFEYNPTLSQTLPLATQIILLGAILIGFGIKIPLFPLHTWLPDAHVEASTPISVLLAGVLLKLGTYGLLRFGLQLFPQAWATLAPGLAIWAVVSVLFGAFTAIAQTDMKKMVAYSSVGHMGFILLAAAAATPLSMLGAVFQMISHGLISALLFALVGVVYTKTGTRDITVLKGLLAPEKGLPIIGSLMIVGVMASAGIPGMVGFISEFLIFRGSFNAFPLQTLLSMIGTGLTAVYFLLLVNRTFFGRLPDQFANLPPVQWSERAPSFVLAALIVVFGLQPSWMIRWTESTTTAMLQEYSTIAKTHSSIEPVSSLPME
ncbi:MULTISPECIES: NADH-quinone oxidoreductase subunit M [Leptolyngbya]|jgi:NAD(P)H-quinone oxidoreductase subunit 4|uniref:Proton-translocating NADH-quinone oxidoreductase, chain M n=2 Tax=Leptolyngbya boryana TaxID=1184 RepID=A0A1Z4JPC2_LEPBY|nr:MULTISPECIES: NADH-quinone oxidoreductase subunit M [Leptolyngbya]BAY58611.1 proton-translocating NADH-quinone oxidoreductase, chain M [Leptolyngbya boryana NIES-2135]MBD1858837.1 NADH-quinone oxidoreductase subunit M [Leptolyngbya sp. FACHB-1624]MBD2370714.1 NADH-quinone oxidoreductase subunit M [Leptolyngbya sp. FACHB-161]MBD2377133.1 NADH-quinone oxidoreductase subunit M [Leptolyngbya sp. FACHB-238]MBD2401576.1 NADH-quinone oxidoreductase subunit M [Leptolyngbya sp. FACHB-239]